MGEDLGRDGKALVQMPEHFDHKVSFVYVKACVVDRLTPQTPNLEVRVSLDKVLYSTFRQLNLPDADVNDNVDYDEGFEDEDYDRLLCLTS